MALTVAQAFNEFKDKLELTATQNTTVSGRRDSAHNYVAKSFPATSDMPLLRTKLIGSAQRGTIIRPLDDLDVLAVFENKDDVFEKYRTNSFAFINRVRDALNQYEVHIVGTRGQAVRLFYKVLPHVDIAPVFSWRSGGYALPDGSGGWLTTDPDKHNDYLNERNKELSYRLKPLARMLKRWNKVHGGRLKSFHIEVMIAEIFSSLGGDSREACEMFFRLAQSNLRVVDPAGYGGDLSVYLSANNRLLATNSLEAARERAARANRAEINGDHKEAIRLWGIIFGSDFPAHG